VALPLQRSFDDLGAALIDVPFCVLDLETTGGSAASCEITEIGAVRYLGGEVEGTFQTLVDPGAPIPPFITVLTGITQAMVVEAPPIEEAFPAFLEFLGEAVVVGHNVRFDLSFLDAAAERLGYGRLRNRSVDTAGLARRLVRREVRNLKLGTLAAHFRSPVTPTHRALDDARATAHVLWGLLERAGTIGVTHLEDLLRLPTARGSAHYGKIALADSLPRRPGVYLFRDRNGEVFYVGKAKNLRSRVRAYFYGDERRSIAQMLRELDEIDHRVCETELEAQITEIRLIAAHRPRHNRRSRPPKSPQFVKLTRERFPRLSIVRTLRHDGLAYLGPFRSRRAATAVVEALWDAAPLRRCSGPPGRRDAPCATAQLGVALCPCDGTLDESEYRPVVEQVVAGIEEDPALLLDPLAERVAALAGMRRFEEAAWVRDRHRALARSLERRRHWHALQDAGTIWAEGPDGSALVDGGRLAAAWSGGIRPLTPAADEREPPAVPPTTVDAEEAHLLWAWLTSGAVRVVDAGGPIALPARPVTPLERIPV
jgi:DNA polymerase-3 subunit epsilon